uniref:Ring finger protein 150 n=1 Tax=Anser cygnoides TaxID=8845 RepID=A0A8B9D949_ANSCY
MPHPTDGHSFATSAGWGKEIVSLLERNITVMMYITIGTRNLQKYVSRTSVVFVSISFIVLMIISLAWLVFYYIQRFRYANARDRNQRRLGDAAKKAISKLQVRTIRKGDKETEPDFDNCAVCIEGYKPNDVVRILPCRHLFHKSCVDPWLLDHRTCPMCKMNILKALGIPVSTLQRSWLGQMGNASHLVASPVLCLSVPILLFLRGLLTGVSVDLYIVLYSFHLCFKSGLCFFVCFFFLFLIPRTIQISKQKVYK